MAKAVRNRTRFGMSRPPQSAFMAMLMLAASTCSASAQLMAPAGKFEVSSGTATYSLPIAVPPGTAGVRPTLTLEYSSQSQNGILGIGWSLGGLPAITRCPQTMLQNGVAGRINFDANDRFCLNGQQINAIAGAYGADGTEYRTEIETFNRIISHGSTGTGPVWFEVRTKDGQILQLGNTSDSRPLTLDATARSWLLNKLSDTKGNYFTVTYTNDFTNGQIYPTRIDYTGNAGAGLTPYNSVQFEYATRPDVVPVYHAGAETKTTVRLTKVKTFAGGILVSEYRLAYEQGPGSLRSRVTSITLCVGDGTCMPATTFTWTNGGTGTFTEGSQTFSGTLYTRWTGGDFDANGKSDFIFLRPDGATGSYTKFLSNGDGTFGVSTGGVGGGAGFNEIPSNFLIGGDFNGDSRFDFANFQANDQGSAYIRTSLTNADGTFTTVQQNFSLSLGGTVPKFVAGDFDADGKSDFLIIRTSANQLIRFLSAGDGTFVQATQSLDVNYTDWTLFPGDFNGDGRTDFALVSYDTVHAYLAGTDGWFTKVVHTITNFGPPPLTASYTPLSGDFNGDGKTDFAFAVSETLLAYLSRGDGTFEQIVSSLIVNYGAPPHASYTPITGDFNGDGKSEFAFVGGSGLQVYLSRGDATFDRYFQPLSANYGWPPEASWKLMSGDFDGDGQSDFAFVSGTTINRFMSVGSVPDLLASITTGLGDWMYITYAPMTQGGFYTKDTNATYPVVDMIGANYLVAQVDRHNGIGGTYSASYSYAGAKSNVLGRFLGFRQVTVQDLENNIVQTTNYRQDFPYIGMPESATKVLGGITLNQGTTTFQFSNASGAASVSTPTITSAPYRVSVAQTVAASKDLDGSVMPTVTTTNQFDAFGNATQIVVSTPDGFSKTTTNTYSNDMTNWYLGRLTGSSVLSTTPY